LPRLASILQSVSTNSPTQLNQRAALDSGHVAVSPPEDEEWCDPTWRAGRNLAAPEIFGSITRALVREKHESFSRYGDDRSSQRASCVTDAPPKLSKL
jgi:hypothetical protein